jgi:surfactin synthase thioesterase subunit
VRRPHPVTHPLTRPSSHNFIDSIVNSKSKYIWISTNPSFKNFHRPLLRLLSSQFEIEFWEYYQTPDENCSIAGAVWLLRNYLLSSPSESINLIGHGMGGVIALEYARQYPQAIDSVALLSVASQPAITWQYYYYQQLRLMRSSRQCLLKTMAVGLLPSSRDRYIRDLVNKLDRDLLEAPSEHSPCQLTELPQSIIYAPLAVFQSYDDPIVNAGTRGSWKSYLKPEDIFDKQSAGGHFFHYFHPHQIASKISKFWLDDRENLDYDRRIDRDRYSIEIEERL